MAEKQNNKFSVIELERTKYLLEISRKIGALKNLSEILWTIIDYATQIVDGDRGSIFLNDKETNELYSRVAQGELTREIRILNNVGIAGSIFQSKTGEIIHDVYKDERFNKDVDQETGYKTRNMICSPIKTIDGQTIGVIQILNKTKGRFTLDYKEDYFFLNIIATSIGHNASRNKINTFLKHNPNLIKINLFRNRDFKNKQRAQIEKK